ncbi:MAG: peptide-methionine (R)-S-oxide reductase MsrB [bacterium]|nr:peptide-methionine (R)-S-oxide reductase MsrB [bacterium]MDZ4231418.1 peptide-methionine (R)-S-oxide reductase MsrB [Patescibacteria group bacterium]
MTEEDFKEKLTPLQYKVLRKKATEPPFTGEYVNTKDKGVYRCRACGAELFGSETKFDSGTGWPSFTEPMNRENVKLEIDTDLGMERVEVVCKKCGSHLGHVFDDGPKDKGGKRFCINSCALDLDKT